MADQDVDDAAQSGSESNRTNAILLSVLKRVGALDPGDETLSVSAINADERAAIVDKLKHAIALVNEMPRTGARTKRTMLAGTHAPLSVTPGDFWEDDLPLTPSGNISRVGVKRADEEDVADMMRSAKEHKSAGRQPQEPAKQDTTQEGSE
jgi:hypothetical protein